MPDFIMRTISIDKDTAAAARRLRELVNAPAGADLAAGVDSMSVDTLERLHMAIGATYWAVNELIEVARGQRIPITGAAPIILEAEQPRFRYWPTLVARFDVVTAEFGQVVGHIRVRKGGEVGNVITNADARAKALETLNANRFRFAHCPTGAVELSDKPPVWESAE